VEDRAELGIFSTSERMQPTLPGVEESATPSVGLIDDGLGGGVGTGAAAPGPTNQSASAATGGVGINPLARAEQRDAPYCYSCGNAMQRAGSCYVCASCGTTSGCS
jgi:ribonucleoside-diphosphate reductase alpha chain